MTILVRTILITTLAALVGATASLPAYATQRSGSRHGASSFDGRWSVLLQTMRGHCPAAVRAGVHILGGRVLTEDQGFGLEGRVAPSGTVRVTVSASGQGGDASGHLSRGVGRGRWRTWSGECSGEWIAERHE